MTRIVPVFVNSAKVEIASDSTALDAVRKWNKDAAREVSEGTRILLDDRGLPIDAGAIIHAGSIFRLVPARAAGDTPDETVD